MIHDATDWGFWSLLFVIVGGLWWLVTGVSPLAATHLAIIHFRAGLLWMRVHALRALLAERKYYGSCVAYVKETV